MGSIQGGSPISPRDIAEYRQEFKRSVNLFQNSLTEYNKADEEHKKAKMKDVMEKALHVMNETAKVAISRQAQAEKKQLQEDYQAYISHESPEGYKKLNDDIKTLKGSI